MRLTFDGIDGQRPLGLSEGDPLPPDDRRAGYSEQPRIALESLYRSQAPRLMRFFARRTDRQDAGDLVQESFVRPAGASDERSPEQPEAYLNQIATNPHEGRNCARSDPFANRSGHGRVDVNADHPISMLIWFTFAAVLVIVVASFIYFMRKRSNRHSMDGERERNIGEIRSDSGEP